MHAKFALVAGLLAGSLLVGCQNSNLVRDSQDVALKRSMALHCASFGGKAALGLNQARNG